MSNPVVKMSLGVASNEPIPLTIKPTKQKVSMGVAAPIMAGKVDPYAGPYSVTPTQAEQILPTKGKTADQNIVVNPIPNNYGLITWNGSVLTVS